MIKKTMIATGIALAITTTLTANIALAEEESSFMDELEISGELKNESAVFTKSGQTIGQATSTTDTTTNNSSGDLYKSENTARFFINGDVGEEGSSFHAELNLRYDTEGTDGYKGAKSYSQHDLLRELYVDTEVGNEDNPISIRAGKQQVVWGTADGIKLLDIINPTDWREMAQNSMEDSRIPVWMLNAEMDLESGGNVQFILSQAEENKIAGFSNISTSTRTSTATRAPNGSVTSMAHTNIDSADKGQTFIMKGVDTISGRSNGFLNIVPELATVAGTFGVLSAGFANSNVNGAFNLQNWTYANVQEFATNTGSGSGFGGACGAGAYANINTGTAGATSPSSAYCLDVIAQTTNENITALLGDQDSSVTGVTGTVAQGAGGLGGNWDTANPNSVFEYMDQATFATFATFAGASSKYVVDHPSDSDLNIGTRYKGNMDNGLNYSFNYTYQYDQNPYIDLEWQNEAGTTLNVTESKDTSGGGVLNTDTYYTILLDDGDGDTTKYGYYQTGTAGASAIANPAVMVFTEKKNKIHNMGSSLDYSLETDFAPVVLRGEFLYQKDVMSPVVNKAKLRIGNLTEGLTSVKGDRFKYVLGADVTVMTNLMLSGQFIQDRNLDFIDETVTAGNITGARYTADQSAMHLTNGLQKAEENKEFYSFFMSKPFGAEQQHRWNNIFMFEENGGKWNRADVEYSFSDEIIGSAEYNKYWGDENTQFGQMEKSSNFQLGLKYIF